MNKEQAEKLAKSLFKKKDNQRLAAKNWTDCPDKVEAERERPGWRPQKMEPDLKDGESGWTTPPEADALVIEDNGAPAPLAPVGDGKIIYRVMEQENAKESQDLNQVARERLERQISTLMAQVSQSVLDYNNALKDALDVLEMARTTVYTHPMGEVSVNLHEAARRLSDLEPEHSRRTNALGNLAMEIRQSEQLGGGK